MILFLNTLKPLGENMPAQERLAAGAADRQI